MDGIDSDVGENYEIDRVGNINSAFERDVKLFIMEHTLGSLLRR